jgi:hypothetical protein
MFCLPEIARLRPRPIAKNAPCDDDIEKLFLGGERVPEVSGLYAIYIVS